MLTRSTTIWSLTLVLLAMGWPCAATLADEEVPYRPEIGIQGGFFLPDEDLSNEDSDLEEIEPTGGVRFNYLLGKRWGWFVDGLHADSNTRTSGGDVETIAARTGFEVYSKPHWKKLQWFFGLGGGWMDFDVQRGEDFDRTFVSASLGQRIMLDDRARLRWELRGDQTVDDDAPADVPEYATLDDDDITRLQILVAVTWGLGRNRSDADGDGVIDRRDKCPDTPPGATVDADGCPKDSDGDGVYDGIDKCPGTPPGAVVDEWGCPKDSDGDGVYDGIDRCPGTPKGATVDQWGCPKDSDGDGVFDGIDRCPNTPRGAIVDERGCPLDSDGDGVYDGIDKCPGTPKGTPVNPDGCPKAAPLFEEGRKTLILEGVFFEFDAAILTPESSATLDRVARSMKDWPEVRVEVAGHTDWIGSDDYNLDLSHRRAQAVRDYLASRGVAANRLKAQGYGEGRPIADNKTEAGRSKNRRVELNRLD